MQPQRFWRSLTRASATSGATRQSKAGNTYYYYYYYYYYNNNNNYYYYVTPSTVGAPGFEVLDAGLIAPVFALSLLENPTVEAWE